MSVSPRSAALKISRWEDELVSLVREVESILQRRGDRGNWERKQEWYHLFIRDIDNHLAEMGKLRQNAVLRMKESWKEESKDKKIPDGWHQLEAETGATFFLHKGTKATTWDWPSDEAVELCSICKEQAATIRWGSCSHKFCPFCFSGMDKAHKGKSTSPACPLCRGPAAGRGGGRGPSRGVKKRGPKKSNKSKNRRRRSKKSNKSKNRRRK